MHLRIGWAVTALTMAACAADVTSGGPVPQFNGDYEIVEVRQDSGDLPGPFDFLPRVPVLTRQTEAIGSIEVAPIVGDEYAEWKIVFNEPLHEIHIVLGPKRADGTYAIWRFEQQPAPKLAHEGIARLEGNQLVAEFPLLIEADPRHIIRERWTLTDDGLEFEFQGGVEEGPFKRAGGFVAVRD